MKILNFNSIRELNISPLQCVEWTKEILLNKYECILPHKISLSIPELDNVFYNTMPSYIPAVNRFGVKVVSRYPKREPALLGEILLYDVLKGEILSFMDGVWITTMRTGAVAALSIEKLEKKAANNYAFIGLGNTARATLLCLQAIKKDRPIEVGLLAYKGQENLFIERFKEYNNITFSVFNNIEDLIANSDVVVSCVTATNSIFAKDEAFNPGILVVPVHTKGFQNCDLFFDKVFADDVEHVRSFKYFEKFKQFDEFSNILLNKNSGRTSEEERILAYNIGISLHDIYFASKIYDILEKNHSTSEDIFTMHTKFWA